MSTSYAYTINHTFTRAHARKISYRVATDLKRMQRLYGQPTDYEINEYDQELVEFINAKYLKTVTYGYRRDNKWIEPTLRYTAYELVNEDIGDDPGRIRPNANVAGATFCSYLTYSTTWDWLSPAEKEAFKRTLPFRRGYGPEPGIDGLLQQDLSYSSGGRGLLRSTVRSWK